MINLTDAYDEQNIFAKILRGELPAIKLYEDDATRDFVDGDAQGPVRHRVGQNGQHLDNHGRVPCPSGALQRLLDGGCRLRL